VDIGYAEYRKGLESEDLTPQQVRVSSPYTRGITDVYYLEQGTVP
jgi:hypothetical protein